MPFNWNDPSQPPFTGAIMVLTHDECVKVKAGLQKVVDEFEPSYDYPEANQTYIINTYNRANLYEPINGATYSVLEGYDPEVNTQGIDANGIIPEPTPEEDQETDPEPDQTEPAPEETKGEEEV